MGNRPLLTLTKDTGETALFSHFLVGCIYTLELVGLPLLVHQVEILAHDILHREMGFVIIFFSMPFVFLLLRLKGDAC